MEWWSAWSSDRYSRVANLQRATVKTIYEKPKDDKFDAAETLVH